MAIAVPSLDEFRYLLADSTTSENEIVDSHVLCPGALHVPDQNIETIRNQLAAKFGLENKDLVVVIVGSAKLGFSLIEKRGKNGDLLPRYRPFGPDSDIDVAVISPKLFKVFWRMFAIDAHRQPNFPIEVTPLATYMTYGWIRPDHFPPGQIDCCFFWWNLFNEYSRNPAFGRRKVRGALYFDRFFLQQ